jgi:hypothetical protein
MAKELFQKGKVYSGNNGYYYRLDLDDNLWQVYYGRSAIGCSITTSVICSKNIEYRDQAENFMIQYGCIAH